MAFYISDGNGVLTKYAGNKSVSNRALTDASNLSSANVTNWKDKLLFEQVETIYDKDSANSDINWGYTSGMSSGTSKSFNFSKYKYLRITTANYTSGITYLLNLKNTDLNGAYSGAGTVPINDTSGLGPLIIFGKAIVTSGKSSITVRSGFLRTSNNTVTENYKTTRIEGIY